MASNISGGGGFYKYRCKYFYYTKSCENWVYVNGEACISCLAEGCESEASESTAGPYSLDICMPFIRQGVFEYILVAGQQGETEETPTWRIPPPPPPYGSIGGAVPHIPRR